MDEDDEDDEDDVDYEQVDPTAALVAAEAKKKKRRYKYLPKHMREKHVERPLYSTQMAAKQLKPLRPLQEGTNVSPGLLIGDEPRAFESRRPG